jgi:outer membrane biosynthesis protein TonB
MMIRSFQHVAIALAFGAFVTAAFTGCDYWPPALQAQIEQLRTEAQTAAADKALLQNQLNASNKAKEELQTRVEELTRINKEKSAMLANLERALSAERERTAKLTKGTAGKTKQKPTTKPAAKPSPKPSPKPPAKTAPKKKSSAPPPKRVADMEGSGASLLVAMKTTVSSW